MGKNRVTVSEGMNSFVFDGKTYGAGDPFETDDPCRVLAFYNAFKAENPEAGRTNRTPDFWKKMEAECLANPGAAPSPGTSSQGDEGQPVGADSGDAQGAPSVAGSADGEDTSATSASGTVPTDEEPTRPPAGEAHPTRSAEQSQQRSESGDPVDLFDGALYLQESDLEVFNTILPLKFIRFYRSGAAVFGPLGWNWDHNYNLYLRKFANGNVALWRNLHEDVFVFDGVRFEPPRGVFEILTPVGGLADAYEITGRGGAVMRFERPAGWTDAERIPIVRLRDRHGNQLSFFYGTENMLVRIEDDDARFLQFTYDECGVLTSANDQVGRAYRYAHDEQTRHLMRVTGPATPDHPAGVSRTYHYEKPFAPSTLRHNILRIEDDEGRIYLENEYEQDPASWSFARITRQLTAGYLFQFRYTELQWVPAHPIHVNIPVVRVEVMNPDFGLETFTFNYRGDLLDRRFRLNKDRSFRIAAWQYEYDDQANLAVLTKPDGSQVINVFDTANADPRMRGNLLQRELTAASGFPAPSRIVWKGKSEPAYQLLVQEEDEKGAITKYRYDFDLAPGAPSNSGKLRQIIYPDVLLPDGSLQTSVMHFDHNEKGQLTALTQPDGTTRHFVYGAAGNDASRMILSRVDPSGLNLEYRSRYDDIGCIRENLDPNGSSRQWHHNALGQLERQIEPAIGGNAATTFFRYDAAGNMISVAKPKGAYGGLLDSHIVDRVERDVLGYPMRYRLSENTSEQRTFVRCNDYQGRPVELRNPDGSAISRAFDERGLLLSEEQRGADGTKLVAKNTYDRTGRVIRETDAAGLTNVYHYDGFGRVATIDLANGSRVARFWGKNDVLLAEEVEGDDGRGNVRLLRRVSYDYDARDRKVKETVRSFADDPPAHVGLATDFFFDEMDRLAAITDGRGARRQWFYDRAGRLTREVDAEGNEERHTVDKNGNVVEVESHHREPSGVTTVLVKRFAYDDKNRPTQRTEPDGGAFLNRWDDRDLLVGRTSTLGVSDEIRYNAFSEKIEEILDSSGAAVTQQWAVDGMGRIISYRDPSGQSSIYHYDKLGRLDAVEYPNGAVSRRQYDEKGLLRREELGSGVVLEYLFDAANRLAAITNPQSPAPISSISPHQFGYDGLDRLVWATSGADVVERTYDSLDRLVSETTNGATISCRYDDLNGLATKSWPDGRKERYAHDLNGILSSIAQTDAGHLGSASGVLAHFSPSGPDYFGEARYQNQFTTVATFDERKRVVEWLMSNTAATNEAFKYRYDSGNRRRVEAIIGATSSVTLHDFDGRERLIRSRHGLVTTVGPGLTQAQHDAAIGQVEGSSGSAAIEETFSYNDADERLTYSQTGIPTKNYTYQSGHRLAGDGVHTYVFHPDGTLRSDGTFDYVIDALGRVIRVERGGMVILQIEYDALGRPSILRESGLPKLSFNYLGDFVEQENRDDVPHKQWTLHPSTGIPIACHVSGASYYSMFDARSNLVATADLNGNLLETYKYRSFGVPMILNSSGSAVPSSQFEMVPVFGGQRYLSSVGLYLSLRRLMNPVDGVYLSPDPRGYVDSPSLYVYASQNPIDSLDPKGEEKSSPEKDAPEKDDWKLLNNPVWNIITNDALGFTTTLFEKADPFFTNFENWTRGFRQMELFSKNRFLRTLGRFGSRSAFLLDDLLRIPTKMWTGVFGRNYWTVTSLGMNWINAFLAPLGLVSNTQALREALFTSKDTIPERFASAVFAGAGLTSSAIGTTALLGEVATKIGWPIGRTLLRFAAGRVGFITGAAAGGWAIGSLLRKTGYGDTSGWLGASVANKLLEYDSFLPDAIDTAGSYTVGFTVTVVGTVVVEPVAWGGKKIGQGLSFLDEAVMPEGRTLNPVTGIKAIARWENPFW